MLLPEYKRVELGEYIVADQGVCHGKPTFKGTRILVNLVIQRFCEGLALPEVARRYELPQEAICEALKLAAKTLREHCRLPAPSVVPMEKLLAWQKPAKETAVRGEAT